MAKKETIEDQANVVSQETQDCGIIMPISSIDDCSAEHWNEVKSIIGDAIKSAGLNPNLVSDANDSGVIQKRIVQNIYSNEIVICDVSCKNPNVMFELGMRLAFDKPTILVMDDKTGYSFDTSVIEHICYPRDLRYHAIIEFKNKLKEKILGTLESSKDSNYTTFLKHFGEFKVASIETKEVGLNEAVLESLSELTKRVDSISSAMIRNGSTNKLISRKDRTVRLRDLVSPSDIRDIIEEAIQRECVINGIGREMANLNGLNVEKIATYVEDYYSNRDILLPRDSIYREISKALPLF